VNSLELRAATSLSHLWQQQGKRRTTCWLPSTTGSPRALTLPTSGRLKHYLTHWERRKATLYNSVVWVSAVNPNAWSGRQCRRREAATTAQLPSICRAVVKAALARAPSVATKPPACQPVGAPVPVVAGSVLCPGAPVQPAGAPVQPAGAPVQPVPCRSK
jgi:hypothetical protein